MEISPVVPGRFLRLAAEFWERTGTQPAYPCDLENILNLYWLPVHRVAGLCVQRVAAWLAHAGRRDWLSREPDRPLHGFLLAYRGRAVIFIEANDPPDERRLTLAHEFAHYLLEYHDPRRRLMQAAGPAALAALDGIRPPTVDERMRALLAGVPLDVHVHLLDRLPDGSPASARIARCETDADLLAFELLAPQQEVYTRVQHLAIPARWADRVATLTRLLVTDFGLPVPAAHTYADRLARSLWAGPGFRDWLET